MDKTSPRSKLSTAIGMALTFAASHALADDAANATASDQQKTPEQQKKAQNKDSTQQLDQINVRGNVVAPSSPKFTAPLIDTPQSVTILPQAVMQETAATSLQDALRNIPGITFAAGEGGTPTGDLPSIRGFNSTSNIYVDGMRDIGLQSRDIFDLEQVEVIKGPDSSIAGRSMGGGSINLVTKSAKDQDFTEIMGTYGSAGQYRVTADSNIKLSDTVAARLSIMDMGGGTPGRDSAVRTDKVGFAPTLTFGIGTPTRLTFDYYHFEDNSTPDYGIPVDYLNTGLPVTQTQGVNRENFYGLADRDFRVSKIDAASARFEHDFSDAFTLRSQVRSTTSENNYLLTLPYLATAADGSLEPGLVYRLPIGNVDRTDGLISQTDLFGHFETGFIRHDVDVGVELSQEKERLAGGGFYTGLNVVSSSGPQGFNGGDCYAPSNPIASYDCTSLFNPNPRDPWQGTATLNRDFVYYTTTDVAPYAFDTMTLDPHWKINAGVRWDDYHTKARSPSDPVDYNASDALKFASYQVSLMYKPVENGTIYLTNSTASVPEDLAQSAGGDQAFPSGPGYPSSTGLKPEKTRTLELGTKWNLFDSRLLLSGDVFDEKHTNAAIEVAPNIYEQVGKTRVKGVEVSANGSITEQWNIIAGYSYLDATITSGGIYDVPGQQLPNTPRNTFSLWSTYRLDEAITFGAGAYYRDKQIGYAGIPYEYIKSYWRFDTMAKWAINSHFALQANVQNIFNKAYYSKIFYWYALPAAGRTFMLSADVKF